MNQSELHSLQSLVGDEPFVDPLAQDIGPAAKLMGPKLLPKLRKAGRVAAVYVLSYAAVKALDKAAEAYPDSKLVYGADQIANVVFGFENLAVSGTLLIAQAGYDALMAPSAPKQPALQPTKPKLSQDTGSPESAYPHHKPHRNRALLNAKLVPDVREPATPLFTDSEVGVPQTGTASAKKLAKATHAPRPKWELKAQE